MQSHEKGRKRSANDAMRARLHIARYVCKSSCLVMMVAGFRLSWVLHAACVLAYVSNGSFISQPSDPCRQLPRAEGRSPRLGAERGPSTAAMPEEEV